MNFSTLLKFVNIPIDNDPDDQRPRSLHHTVTMGLAGVKK